jgi:hypothetical protein
MQAQGYARGPVAAVGNVVVGTGQAVQGVFTGTGRHGGALRLPAQPDAELRIRRATHTAPLSAAPFNAAGAVAVSPFQVVGGAFGGTPAAHAGY